MTDGDVHEAWAAVMADLGGLAKRDRNTHQNFNFRGIDAVMNAVGPVLRTHQVSVRPVDVEYVREHGTTTKGTSMTSSIVNVTYEIVGPDGSTMSGCASGEAFDSGDKSMPKAMSVAFRTFLLQSLCLPTDEPDPDAQTYVKAAETRADRLRARALSWAGDDESRRGQVVEWLAGMGAKHVEDLDDTGLGAFAEQVSEWEADDA